MLYFRSDLVKTSSNAFLKLCFVEGWFCAVSSLFLDQKLAFPPIAASSIHLHAVTHKAFSRDLRITLKVYDLDDLGKVRPIHSKNDICVQCPTQRI